MPDFKITITTAALEDTQNAMEWYNEQQYGLDTRFLNALRESYKIIIKNPESYGFYGGSAFVRRLKLKKFPFYVFYSIVDEIVEIMGVVHTSRSDKYIKSRIV